MSKQFCFRSNELTAAELKSFTATMGDGTKLDFTVSRDAKYMAQNKLSDLATRMHIETKRDWSECLEFVTQDRANAQILRISQAPVEHEDRADVSVL